MILGAIRALASIQVAIEQLAPDLDLLAEAAAYTVMTTSAAATTAAGATSKVRTRGASITVTIRGPATERIGPCAYAPRRRRGHAKPPPGRRHGGVPHRRWDAMTLTASPTRPPPAVAAARTVDATKVYSSGDTAVRALGPTTRGVA